MRELIIYTDRCLTCSESDRTQQVAKFAYDNKLHLIFKKAYMFKEYKQEAEQIGEPMPFIHLEGKNFPFYSVNPKLTEPSGLEVLL